MKDEEAVCGQLDAELTAKVRPPQGELCVFVTNSCQQSKAQVKTCTQANEAQDKLESETDASVLGRGSDLFVRELTILLHKKRFAMAKGEIADKQKVLVTARAK